MNFGPGGRFGSACVESCEDGGLCHWFVRFTYGFGLAVLDSDLCIAAVFFGFFRSFSGCFAGLSYAIFRSPSVCGSLVFIVLDFDSRVCLKDAENL